MLGLVSPIFPSWLSNSACFDLRFGFLVKNCVYSQMGMSRLRNIGQKTLKSSQINKKLCVFESAAQTQRLLLFELLGMSRRQNT